MFTKFTHCDGYPVLVNLSRVMAAQAMDDGGEEFTRLFMNVADKQGEPYSIDVVETLKDIEQATMIEGGHNAA